MQTAEEVRVEDDDYAMTVFKAAHRSSQTLDHNERFLSYFLRDNLGMTADSFIQKSKLDPKWAEHQIVGYFLKLKARVNNKEMSSDSTHNFRDPIKILCDMNDVTALNWKRLDRILPPRRRRGLVRDEAPPVETIRTLLTYPDRRMKPMVLPMVSGGLRVGAWDFLSVRDIEPAMLEGKLVCGKLTVYRGEPEEYKTRISFEFFNHVQEYLEFRRQNGERVKPDSPLMRNLWTGDRGRSGEPHIPIRLKSTGAKRLLEDAWDANPSLRLKREGSDRFLYAATAFGRTFFETHCLRAGLKPWEIKIFRGDVLPADLTYNGPSEEELTKLYLKAMPELTIFEAPTSPEVTREVEVLRKQLDTTQQRFDDLQSSFEAKLSAEIKALKFEQEKDREQINRLLSLLEEKIKEE